MSSPADASPSANGMPPRASDRATPSACTEDDDPNPSDEPNTSVSEPNASFSQRDNFLDMDWESAQRTFEVTQFGAAFSAAKTMFA